MLSMLQDEVAGTKSRAQSWMEAIVGRPAQCFRIPSVIYSDGFLDGEPVRAVAVVPNHRSHFPRARTGEFGVEEGWALANCIWSLIDADRVDPNGLDANSSQLRRSLIAIVDVPGQAYGVQEELLGLHLSMAAAVDAYGTARLKGHPVLALLVGNAISGAFLAHGLQASQIFALDVAEIEVHVMSRASVARVTRRDLEEVKHIESLVPATARDIRSFATLGGIDGLIDCKSLMPVDPAAVIDARVRLLAAIKKLRTETRESNHPLDRPAAIESRKLARSIRRLLEEQWD